MIPITTAQCPVLATVLLLSSTASTVQLARTGLVKVKSRAKTHDDVATRSLIHLCKLQLFQPLKPMGHHPCMRLC